MIDGTTQIAFINIIIMSIDSSTIIELLDPVQHLRTHLDQRVRVDGRGFMDSRSLTVNCGAGEGIDTLLSFKAKKGIYGSAEVRLGGTLVCCDTTLLIGTPSPVAPDEGDLDFDVSLTGICDPKYESFRTKHDDALDLESLLTSVFIDGRIVDLKSLGIAKGEYAFRLCVGVTVLSLDGNLQDAAIVAVMTALDDTRMPDVVFPSDLPQDKATSVKHGQFGRTRNFPCIYAAGNQDKKLGLLALALPLTVAVFLNSDKEWDLRQAVLFVDPTKSEEGAVHSTITTVLRLPRSRSSGDEVELCGVFGNESDDIGSSDPRLRGGSPGDYIASTEDSPDSDASGIIPAAIRLSIEHAKAIWGPRVPFLG